MSRFFVTGATGFLGGQLVQQLREAGDQVVALCRRPAVELESTPWDNPAPAPAKL